jgi:hypothetical protein
MANFSIKTDLLKLKNSFVTNLKGKTETKRCLVIPINDAQLFLGEKGVYLNLTAIEMREERYGDTHVLKQSLPKDVYQAMTDEERNAQPILGSLKPLEPAPAKQMQVTQTTDAATAVEEPDDLPF